jgi:hypothetical protein
MTDAAFMSGFERFEDLLRDREGFLDRHRPAPDALGERVAINQLEHQELDVAGVGKLENAGDVWMIERGDRLGFALEPCYALRVTLMGRGGL